MFGGSGLMDAFLVAFKIPNFFRRLFAEGAFTQSFLPMVIEFQSKKEQQQLKEFLSHTMGFVLIVLIIICALGVIGSDFLILLFAGGLSISPERFELASSMLRITFPYLGFITLTAYCMALQNSHNRFGLPAFTPIILNVTMITSVMFISPLLETPIKAAAWAVLIAGIFQLLVQLPAVHKCALLPLPKFKITLHPSTRRLLILMAPVLLGGSVVQINLLIDTLLASFLAEGSISWLYFAERLIQLPLGVFGIAITTIMMPRLARLRHAPGVGGAGRTGGARATRYFLSWGMRMSLIITLPAALGLIIMAKPILISIYYYGSFALEDINNTALALAAYAIGLPSFVFIKILSSVFFARQDTKTPLKAALIATGIGITLSLTLIWFLQHVGLALATSIGATFNAVFLAFILRKDKMIPINLSTIKFLLQLLTALVVMTVFLLYVAPLLQVYGGSWSEMLALERAVNLAIIIFSTILIYCATLSISGLRWRDINIA